MASDTELVSGSGPNSWHGIVISNQGWRKAGRGREYGREAEVEQTESSEAIFNQKSSS